MTRIITLKANKMGLIVNSQNNLTLFKKESRLIPTKGCSLKKSPRGSRTVEQWSSTPRFEAKVSSPVAVTSRLPPASGP